MYMYMSVKFNFVVFRLFKMYNMHGHPWFELLNPKKKNRPDGKLKSIFKTLKNKIWPKNKYLEENYLKEFWESVEPIKSA